MPNRTKGEMATMSYELAFCMTMQKLNIRWDSAERS